MPSVWCSARCSAWCSSKWWPIPRTWGHATKLPKEQRIEMPATLPTILHLHRRPGRHRRPEVKAERCRDSHPLTPASPIHSRVVLLLWLIMRLISELRLPWLCWRTGSHTRHPSDMQRCRRQRPRWWCMRSRPWAIRTPCAVVS